MRQSISCGYRIRIDPEIHEVTVASDDLSLFQIPAQIRCDVICSDEAGMIEQVKKYFEAVGKL